MIICMFFTIWCNYFVKPLGGDHGPWIPSIFHPSFSHRNLQVFIVIIRIYDDDDDDEDDDDDDDWQRGRGRSLNPVWSGGEALLWKHHSEVRGAPSKTLLFEWTYNGQKQRRGGSSYYDRWNIKVQFSQQWGTRMRVKLVQTATNISSWRHRQVCNSPTMRIQFITMMVLLSSSRSSRYHHHHDIGGPCKLVIDDDAGCSFCTAQGLLLSTLWESPILVNSFLYWSLILANWRHDCVDY